MQYGEYAYAYEKHFGKWTDYLLAAFGTLVNKLQPKENKKDFKPKIAKLDSFTVHETDLKLLFELCGNPKTLKIVAQPDTHVEYMDDKAWSCYLSFLDYYKPHGLINLGDFLNAEGLSHWPSDCFKPKRFIPEAIRAREVLAGLNTILTECKFKFFLCGNHEDWIRQAFVAKLPEFFDGSEAIGMLPTVDSILALDSFGYQFIPLNHFLKIGKAHFTHGLYTTDNHPKRHLDVVKKNIYYGHLHDTKTYNTISIDGPMEAASLGCLCRLDAKFLKGRPNNWVHAFGIFEFFPDGSYTRLTPKIINGRMSYNGIVFE